MHINNCMLLDCKSVNKVSVPIGMQGKKLKTRLEMREREKEPVWRS